MAVFQYRVRDARGAEFTGTIEADSEQALRTNLVDQGYVVSSIQKTKGTGVVKGRGRGMSRFKRVKLNDLAQFCRQFATMINAGVTVVRCLSVLQEQTTNPNLRAMIADIRAEVEGGNSLSGAMAKYSRTFSTWPSVWSARARSAACSTRRSTSSPSSSKRTSNFAGRSSPP
ncbi:MAG TPA: type II secretion system F family protein [Armatimonadota bacterium]|nr:type II secretion system F family protein [Armatimonadota bacterium]